MMALAQSQRDASPTGGSAAAQVPVQTTASTNAPTSQQNLPMRKRKKETGNLELCVNEAVVDKRVKTSSDSESSYTTTTTPATTSIEAMKTEAININLNTTTASLKPLKRPPMSKAREIRLEQNRKAARESRRRKKVMVEELQRSVVFFTRANSTLKQQNEELERMLLQAQSHIQAYENGRATQPQGSTNNTSTVVQEPSGAASCNTETVPPTSIGVASQKTDGSVEQTKESRDSEAQQAVASAQTQQVQKLPNVTQEIQAHHAAQAAATQAMFETKGFPPAAARAAAQTFVAAPGDSDGKVNASTAAAAVTQPKFANASNAGNIALATNPWSFLVTMAPGQMSHLANPQQQGASVGVPTATPQASGAITSTTGKTEFNPFFAMQMQPFLTTVLGANGASISMPIMQLAAMNKGNLAANHVSTSQGTNNSPPTSASSTNNEMKG